MHSEIFSFVTWASIKFLKLLESVQTQNLALSSFLGVTNVIVVYFIYKRYRFRYPPGPRSIPILWPTVFDPDTLKKKYGNVFGTYLGPMYVVVCNGMKSAAEFCNNQDLLERPESWEFIPDGNGFTGLNGYAWTEQRNFAMVFLKDVKNGKIQWEDYVKEEVQTFILNLRDSKSIPMDIRKLLSESVSSGVASMSLGQRLSADDPQRHITVEFVRSVMDIFTRATFLQFYPNVLRTLSTHRPFKWVYRKYKDNYEKMFAFAELIRNEVKKQKAFPEGLRQDNLINRYLKKQNEIFFQRTEKNSGIRGEYYKSFERQMFSVLDDAVKKVEETTCWNFTWPFFRKIREEGVAAKHYQTMMSRIKSYNDRNLVGMVQALINGGGETTASSLLWLFVIMAEKKEEQNKIFQEINKVFGKSGDYTYNQRNMVPYTYATILEAQRWRTLVPISVLRRASKNTKISDYDIPKGTLVVLNIKAIHSNPDYWKNHEKFDPTRFMGSNTYSKGFQAFTAGKRSCPGDSIAFMLIFHYFIAIVQNFEISVETSNKGLDGCFAPTFQPLPNKFIFKARS